MKLNPKVTPKPTFYVSPLHIPSRKPKGGLTNENSIQWLCKDYINVRNPSVADIIVFTGGGDIHPSLYNQSVSPRSRTTESSERRDTRESILFSLAMKKEKRPLMLGIGRGAQLLNVFSGGSMFQHVIGGMHQMSHSIVITGTNEVLKEVPSSHHQMMIPSKHVGTRDILSVAYDERNKRGFLSGIADKLTPSSINRVDFLNAYTRPDYDPRTYDAEVIWYPTTNSLCIQGHPYQSKTVGHPFDRYCRDLISSKLQEIQSK